MIAIHPQYLDLGGKKCHRDLQIVLTFDDHIILSVYVSTLTSHCPNSVLVTVAYLGFIF
jgi:hypothetical protein